jgi:hypothetical protein
VSLPHISRLAPADVGAVPTSEPANPALIQRLHDTLARAVELEETFEAQHRLPVHASSGLRRDEATGNAASVFNTASAAMVGALDHLHTWYQIVAGDLKRFPLPVFSHYTLAHAAYEPALLTLWLLDPEVDSDERIGRGYAAQLRSLEDMRKFQTDAGMTSAAANATPLYDRLFAAARAAGYVKRNTKGDEQLTVGPPSMVDLFNRYDQPNGLVSKPAWLYRVLSGHTHGREWAMMRGASESDLEGFDTSMNFIRPDLPLLCHLAERTVAVVGRAVAVHMHYRAETHEGSGR